MITVLFSRLIILACNCLYPAYASFKVIRTKNVQDYVKWMMYWIVFAMFSCVVSITDIFLPWFPFYYELKVLLSLWLLPTTFNGSSLLYRNFIHPQLKRQEPVIDAQVARVKAQSYATLREFCARCFQQIRNGIMELVQRTGLLTQLAGQTEQQQPPVVLPVRDSLVISDIVESESLSLQEEIESQDLVSTSSKQSLENGVKKTASKTKSAPRVSSRSRKPRADF